MHPEYFAEVSLEIEGKLIEAHRVPRVVHPKAARVLLLSGYTPRFSTQVFGHRPASQLAGLRLMYVTVTELHFFKLEDLPQLLASGVEGIHLYTNVDSHSILVDDEPIPDEVFFKRLDGFGLKFLYIDTCNSLQVVSAFRKTDIGALIASTENLYEDYANDFERSFYQELGSGVSISQAFQSASMQQSVSPQVFPATRSGVYNPMFLDLRRDFSFGVSNSVD
jgi:hypothetical protein